MQLHRRPAVSHAGRERTLDGVATTDVEEWIPEIVERLAREFDPVKIILFGSHARGEGRDGSDLDLLVVVPRIEDKREASLEMRRALDGIPVPTDVFPMEADEVARTGDSVGSFVYPVLREGRVIYGVDERDEHVWLRYAEEDLGTAERMTSERGWTPRIACFHAQQAAEKALKAVMVAERLPLIYAHNLEILRDALPEERRVRQADVDVGRLTEWAALPRYPGEVSEATPEDGRDAVAAARKIVEAARADLAD